MALEIAERDIGGAVVVMSFNTRGQTLKRGARLTAAEVCAIPRANRKALVAGGFIEIFHRNPLDEESDRFVIQSGEGQYDVIAGRRLNDKPLTRSAAEKLAKSK
jgi:hypothetical protein